MRRKEFAAGRQVSATCSLLVNAAVASLLIGPPPAAAHTAAGGAPTHGPDTDYLEALPEVAGPGGGPQGRPVRTGGRATAETIRLSLPEVWCGVERSDDDLAGELSNGANKYHAIYAYPSDGLDLFLLNATRIQVDALQASALLERLYGRALRFDMGTSCGPQFLDISSVRLRSSTGELQALAGTAEGVFTRIAADLRSAGFDILSDDDTLTTAATRSKNLVVWLDAPGPAGACGQAALYGDPNRALDNWNNYGGKLAIVYRSSSGFCNSNTVRHEIAHNLGAIQPGAANNGDGAHCTDAYEDTMCMPGAPPRSSGEYHALYFDYGNDDYWDPPGFALPRWTVNLSRFVCPDVGCNVPGGSASGGLLDSDTDGVPDALDPCPTTPGTDCEAGGADADASRRRPGGGARVRASARRRGNVWRLRIRTTGQGHARVSVRCRRRAVYRRTVTLPRTLRVSVRCAVRPRAHVQGA